ncbi:MAG: hypothetical protein ACI8SR_002417 [Oceanicoccus sp.]|jgi:hypothetical protein
MKLLKSILIVLALFSAFTEAEENEKKQDTKNELQVIQKEINDLVDQGGKYVYLQLARKNTLSPFAIGREENGNMIMLEVPKSEENASFSDKIYKLRELLKSGAEANKFISAALFVKAQVPHKGKEVDGIAIEMEHKRGMSVLRFLPYEVDRENKKINFDKPIDKVKPNVFFAKPTENVAG